jgi:hypothetical protein
MSITFAVFNVSVSLRLGLDAPSFLDRLTGLPKAPLQQSPDSSTHREP